MRANRLPLRRRHVAAQVRRKKFDALLAGHRFPGLPLSRIRTDCRSSMRLWRMSVFTVPRGLPSCSAICAWLNPSKNDISIARRWPGSSCARAPRTRRASSLATRRAMGPSSVPPDVGASVVASEAAVDADASRARRRPRRWSSARLRAMVRMYVIGAPRAGIELSAAPPDLAEDVDEHVLGLDLIAENPRAQGEHDRTVPVVERFERRRVAAGEWIRATRSRWECAARTAMRDLPAPLKCYLPHLMLACLWSKTARRRRRRRFKFGG